MPKRMDRRESLGGRSTADGTVSSGWVASISDRIRGASCSSRDKAEPSVLCRKKKKKKKAFVRRAGPTASNEAEATRADFDPARWVRYAGW